MRKDAWLVILSIAVLSATCSRPPGTVAPEATAVLENGSFTAELDGHNIHYEVHGHGPVVMALPNSWGLSLTGVRGLFGSLEEGLTMVYFDPRGMGGSDPVVEASDMGLAAVRADFDALRRHLGLDKVHAIGWSNGAMNLILLAANSPATIESAIFVHGAASFTEEDMQRWAERQPELMRKWLALDEELGSDTTISDADRTARQKAFWVEEVFPASCANPTAAREMLVDFYRDVEFSWAHAQYANHESPEFDARPRLPDITARCLVVAGAHDHLAPEKVRELHDGLGDSEFVVFGDSGHYAPLEEPEAFRATVFEFLGVG